MSPHDSQGLAVDFLRDQMNKIDTKLARLHHALSGCDDDLEADGLRAALHNAELQRELLDGLILNQMDTEALSLEALAIAQIELYRRTAHKLAQGWQRGHQTPPEYWDAEVKQAFLTELLSHFHAQHHAHAAHTDLPADPATYAYPWFTDPAQDESQDQGGSHNAANQLRALIYSALRRQGQPFDHVHVLIHSDAQVIVTGYAHTAAIREQILQTITTVAGVQHVLSDIKVVDEARCPVCYPERNGARPAPPG